ncbi:MAG: DNA recombination/repair protein RecA, partial [Candidatus Latescibacteria bacterium]|nr:DNA recombination/repair protein RecA [Candidatus Latescibacterota bacterium]
GNALKFYATVRIDIRRIAAIKDGQDSIGNRTRVKVVKNKVAPPFRMAEFDLMYGANQWGISKEGGLVDMGVNNGILTKSGTWFSYGDDRLGQGRENAKSYLREHPDTAREIEEKVRQMLHLGGPLPTEESEKPETDEE